MAPHHHASSWTERVTERGNPSPDYTADIESLSQDKRQAFHHPKTSYGGRIAGHWLPMIGGLLPLALSELIPDAAKYRKATRIASIGTTVAYEVLYTVNELKRRKEHEAKLTECHSRLEQCEH